MTKFEKVFSNIDLKKSKGLEIGALDNPMVDSSQYQVEYLDYTDSNTLRENHKHNPFVNVNQIVEVHHIWGQDGLAFNLGKEQFDYVVASHVIEHIPDLITWLNEIHEVLKSDGILALVVPDKRFIFDFPRNLTSAGDWIQAFHEKRRRPGIKEIFDHFSQHSLAHPSKLWRRSFKKKLVHDSIYALEQVRRLTEKQEYVDVHCWVLEPFQFVQIMKDLSIAGLIKFQILQIFPTEVNEIDFVVVLKKIQKSCPESSFSRFETDLARRQRWQDSFWGRIYIFGVSHMKDLKQRMQNLKKRISKKSDALIE